MSQLNALGHTETLKEVHPSEHGKPISGREMYSTGTGGPTVAGQAPRGGVGTPGRVWVAGYHVGGENCTRA